MRIRVPAPKFKVEETGDGIVLRMPYAFRTTPTAMWLFMALLVVAWPLLGLVLAIAFRSVWWAVGGLAFVAFMAMITGPIFATYLTLREVLVIAPSRELFERRIEYMGIRTTGTRMNLGHVRGLRVESPPSGSIVQAYSDMFSRRGGFITVDYGSDTYRFGVFLMEAEAWMVVSELAKRFPGLVAPTTGRPEEGI